MTRLRPKRQPPLPPTPPRRQQPCWRGQCWPRPRRSDPTQRRPRWSRATSLGRAVCRAWSLTHQSWSPVHNHLAVVTGVFFVPLVGHTALSSHLGTAESYKKKACTLLLLQCCCVEFCGSECHHPSCLELALASSVQACLPTTHIRLCLLFYRLI